MGNDCCKDGPKKTYRQEEQKNLNQEIVALKNRLDDMRKRHQKELEDQARRQDDMRRRYIKELEDQARRYDEDVKSFKREIYECKQEKTRLEQRVRSRDKQVKELTDENENLKTRLSAIIGAKVRDGNPNIADLSDMNRPTNLSNDYSELYDNKWTDTYEYITKTEQITDKDACKLLCTIFCEIYLLCTKKADQDLIQLKHVLLAFYGTENTEIRKQFKENRKKEHMRGKKEMEKAVMETMKQLIPKDTLRKSETLAQYIDECLKIAWLMSVQDPPVFVDTNIGREGEKFETNVFKPYTASGTEIDFIIWPAVYLAKGEGLLAKGVAQGRQQVNSTTGDVNIQRVPHVSTQTNKQTNPEKTQHQNNPGPQKATNNTPDTQTTMASNQTQLQQPTILPQEKTHEQGSGKFDESGKLDMSQAQGRSAPKHQKPTRQARQQQSTTPTQQQKTGGAGSSMNQSVASRGNRVVIHVGQSSTT